MRGTVTRAIARIARAFWGDEGWAAHGERSNAAPSRAADAITTGGKGARGRRDGARRPSLPPLFYMAVAVWTALLCTSFAIAPRAPLASASDATLAVAAVALALGVLAVALAGWRARANVLSLLAIGVLAGSALSCASELDLRYDERALGEEGAGLHAFTALADASPSDYGASVTARMELAAGGSVRVRVLVDEDGVRCGERFAAPVTVKPSGAEVAARLRAQGIVGTVSAYAPLERHEREGLMAALVELRARAIALFDGYAGEGPALCKAVLFGDRSDLSRAEDFYRDVKSVGLAHLIAVSGSHLVVVVGMVECALRALRVPRGVRSVVVGGFMAAYVVLTGMPVSAVRAAVMCSLALAAPFARRRPGGISALAVCVLVLLASDPTCATSLSLQLSVVSTLGILAFMPLVRSWVVALAPFLPPVLADAVAMTLAASFLTLPLTIPLFSQVPLIAPLANVLAGPVFAVLCCAGLAAVALSLALPALASLALAPIVWLAQAFLEGVSILAAVPYAAVPVTADALPSALAGAAACVAAWIWWPRPSARVLRGCVAVGCALFCALAFVAPRFGPDEVVMLDVGQGDAFLIRSRGSAVLVDTGMGEARLLEELAKEGVVRLDAVLVTHPDADHCKALPVLRTAVQVDRVLVARDGLSCTCGNCASARSDAGRVAPGALEGLAVGDRVHVGAFALRVIGPDAYQDEGSNADSVCFVLEYGARDSAAPVWTALFCGDAEAETVRTYVDEGRVGDVDVLKVAHHGAKAGLTAELAAALKPEIALVSVGEGNTYGHPAGEVLSLLEQAGAAVFRTDVHGAVTCRFTPDAIDVARERA